MAKATKKSESLRQWRSLPAGQNPLKYMQPIPYKARGSRYGACGVRIDGNPQFIDAVLSCLKDLLQGENHFTRLELARNQVDGNGLGKCFENADRGAECCYIRLHVRGHEAQHVGMMYDRSKDSATFGYCESVGAA